MSNEELVAAIQAGPFCWRRGVVGIKVIFWVCTCERAGASIFVFRPYPVPIQ